MDDKDLQISAGRYVFHAVTKQKYAEEEAEGKRTPAGADECYRKAMANYDSIVSNSLAQTTRDANQREMDKGFEMLPHRQK